MRRNKSFQVWFHEQCVLMEDYACSYLEAQSDRDYRYNLRKSTKSFRKRLKHYSRARHLEIDMLYNAEMFEHIQSITKNAIQLHYARVNSRAINNGYDERTKNEILQQAFTEHMQMHEKIRKLKRLMYTGKED